MLNPKTLHRSSLLVLYCLCSLNRRWPGATIHGLAMAMGITDDAVRRMVRIAVEENVLVTAIHPKTGKRMVFLSDNAKQLIGALNA